VTDWGFDTYANDVETARAEPEPPDVHGDQAPADWSNEPRSDDLLSSHVRQLMGAPWT